MTESQIIARVCGGIYIFSFVTFLIAGVVRDMKAQDQSKDVRNYLKAGMIFGAIFTCLYIAVVLWK